MGLSEVLGTDSLMGLEHSHPHCRERVGFYGERVKIRENKNIDNVDDV